MLRLVPSFKGKTDGDDEETVDTGHHVQQKDSEVDTVLDPRAQMGVSRGAA